MGGYSSSCEAHLTPNSYHTQGCSGNQSYETTLLAALLRCTDIVTSTVPCELDFLPNSDPQIIPEALTAKMLLASISKLPYILCRSAAMPK